jgi:hypothetical protein
MENPTLGLWSHGPEDMLGPWVLQDTLVDDDSFPPTNSLPSLGPYKKDMRSPDHLTSSPPPKISPPPHLKAYPDVARHRRRFITATWPASSSRRRLTTLVRTLAPPSSFPYTHGEKIRPESTIRRSSGEPRHLPRSWSTKDSWTKHVLWSMRP